MRKALIIVAIILTAVFIFSFTACTVPKTATETTAPETTATETTAAETTASAPDYNIGDTGPAGGLIFYVNPNYEADGWKYLEAATEDSPGNKNDYSIQWDSGELIGTGATGTSIGTGMSNTQKIVDIQGEGSYAAKLCYDLTQGGFSDWFLPSKEELNLMYENLYLKGLGSFEKHYYWSSSESDEDHAWCQSFVNGYEIGSLEKGGEIRVRAVRAFN